MMPILPLSRMVGGINRNDRTSGPDQCVDALDVIEDGGDLVRRPGFHAVGTAAPFYLPAGACWIYVGNPSAPGHYYDRAISEAVGTLGGGSNGIFIACDEPFDGFEWGPVIACPTPSAHRYLRVDYWNGSTWVALDHVLDTTKRLVTNGSNQWLTPLYGTGRVSWHRSQMTDWATQNPASTTRTNAYVVRLSTMDPGDGSAAPTRASLSGSGDLTLGSPGIRCFLLEPVRSILPYRSRQGRNYVLVGSDRRTVRGSEPGANIGAIKNNWEKTDLQILVADEGAAVMGQVSNPAIYRAAPGQAWPGGTWTTHTAAAGSIGTASTLTRTRREQDVTSAWFLNQFRGAARVGSLAPNALAVQTAWNGTVFFNVTGSLSALKANEFEHFRIRCTVNGGGGTPVGEEREIVRNTAASGGQASIVYHQAFSVAPNTGNRFEILRPHSRLRFRDQPPYGAFSTEERVYEVDAVAGGFTMTLRSGADYEPELADSDDNNRFCSYQVGPWFPWAVRAGRFWCGAFDRSTGAMIVTNGLSGLMVYDGESIRPLTATSDPNNFRVQQWIGLIPPDLLKQAGATLTEWVPGFLRSAPPNGQFVVGFNGRIVVAGGDRVYWSAPGLDNDLWPLGYVQVIRDSENHEISGLAVLHGRLLVFTPTSIHAAYPSDDGAMNFRPIVHGAGPVSHRAVAAIGESMLIYPTADGVYVFDGDEPRAVLDDWEDVVLGGVNAIRMADAVGAYSMEQNRYYLAVPSANSSVPDTVLVFDVRSKAWFRWSAPWGGITEISRDFDENGRETMLFGTADGHIAVLGDFLTDDGDTVTGWARSKTLYPGGLETIQPTHVMIMANETGADILGLPANNLEVRVYPDGNASAQSIVQFMAPEASSTGIYGQAFRLNDAALGVLGTARVGWPERMLNRKIGLAAFQRCSGLQIEVRGVARWRLRDAVLLVGGQSQRSQR